MEDDEKKAHRKRQAGSKVQKKTKNKPKNDKKNVKAFGFQSVKKAAKTFHRKQDLETKKQHIPLVDRTPLEPPPIIVGVVGPPKVGKTTLVNSLIKNFTRQRFSNVTGPVTLVSGKRQRITLIECNNDINCMIDIAKIADLVLLLIDASFGFEMEIFEFLNIAQVHGFPKIMGVLTHLDLMKTNKSLKKAKKKMKHRFWTEVYQGAKLFNLSGITHGSYSKTEIHNLGRFISVMKFRPLKWRSTHPHILADRVEDLTDPEIVRQNPKTDRTVCLYGYMRGAHLRYNSKVHIMGCGDYFLKEISFLPDPCPLPEKEKKRSLNEKERLVYAPMSGVGGVVYDKDAVYIDLGGSQAGQKAREKNGSNPSEDENVFVSSLLDTKSTIDAKISASRLTLFKNSSSLVSDDVKGDLRWDFPVQQVTEANSDRIRRKVVFDKDAGNDVGGDSEDDEDDNENGDESDEEDDDGDGDDEDVPEDDDYDDEGDDDDDEEEPASKRKRKDNMEEDVEFEDDDEEEDENDNEIFDESQSKISMKELEKWKENFKRKFLPQMMQNQSRKKDLRALIYNYDKDFPEQKEEESDGNSSDEGMLGGLFSVKLRENEAKNQQKYISHQRDCSRSHIYMEYSKDDDLEMLYESIKGCFITGKSIGDEKVSSEFSDEDEELYGDFEDLETSDVAVDANSEVEKGEDEGTGLDDGESMEDENTARLAKKEELKKSFDAEYDNETDKDKDNDAAYYEELKKELSLQGQLNTQEFQDMEDDLRVKYEGFRPGMYVRIEIGGMPCEFLENFNPSFPVVLGGLLSGEDDIGFLQARFKKHRWHDKILKNRDPIIISLGWRRFQTLPLYSVQDHNGRQRALKYTPEHLHCLATFYGPIIPPNTGLLAVQSVSSVSSKFRICGTGVIIDQDKSVQVVKKLKLVGTPTKIFRNTAFIKGMFTSSLEVAKFEGAAIRTVSGVRGQIKKSIKSPDGAFRATFEDKILMSDIVFCRTWYPVTCPKYYNPVTSLLLGKENHSSWTGMRTVGEIRKERGIKLAQNADSIYKPIERQTRKFNPLNVPKKLQKDLPFKSKPKLIKKKNRKPVDKLKAVVMEPHEKKAYNLMKELFTIQNEKKSKHREVLDKKRKEFQKKLKKDNERRDSKIKEQKKRIYKILGQEEKRKQKAAASRS